VPSAVSLALKEHIIKYESKPVTIGIVSTSLLYDDVSDVIDGKPVTYTVTKGDQLDATHSHFIIIASDSKNENSEITIKKKLEKLLSKGGKNLAKIRETTNAMNDLEAIANKTLRRKPSMKLEKSENSSISNVEMTMVEKIARQQPIPIVVCVVGGDMESILTLSEDLEYKKDTSTIMLLFEGSGGAADIMAFAVRTANEFGETSEDFRKRVRMRMKSFLFSQVRRSSKLPASKDELFNYLQRFASLRMKVHI
ncbi:uncharacterized protein LOC117120174, partial [Anneissia japonica]|uniref:uncharacterized protein LOC117120174 n=1 Tax=Anneissia japonica TaxID=1529436 RepID=UPI001425A0FC